MASNLVGRRFGKLTVAEGNHSTKSGLHAYLCKCDCGKFVKLRSITLTSGNTRSCGCNQGRPGIAKTHGKSGTQTYWIWQAMKQRCQNPAHKDYRYYGARGIKVCERWEDFENFLSDMGDRPAGMELDRILVDGDYCRDNCRWTTHYENMQNTQGSDFELLLSHLSNEQLENILNYLGGSYE